MSCNARRIVEYFGLILKSFSVPIQFLGKDLSYFIIQCPLPTDPRSLPFAYCSSFGAVTT